MTDFDLYVSNAAQVAAFLHDAAIDDAELILCVGMRTRRPDDGKPVLYISSRVPEDYDVRALLAFMATTPPSFRNPAADCPDDEPRPVSPTRGGICLLCGESHGAAEPCRPLGDLP